MNVCWVFWVNSIAGVNINGDSRSVDTGTSGLELTMAQTSAMNVLSLRNGDVVLLRDKSICRTQWPIGRIVNAIKSSDDHVRKVEVCIIVNGKPTVYTRPISELILLVEEVFV
jgi:hypothetical protein